MVWCRKGGFIKARAHGLWVERTAAPVVRGGCLNTWELGEIRKKGGASRAFLLLEETLKPLEALLLSS